MSRVETQEPLGPGSLSPISPAELTDAAWISEFLRQRWHTTIIVVHGEVIDAAALPALIDENHRGLATYRLHGRDAELVTLDAVPAGAGIGTALIEALSTRLRGEGCERLWVTTTNDKLAALRFYLRRGFRLIQVRPGLPTTRVSASRPFRRSGSTGFPSMTNSTCAASSISAQDGKCPFSRRGAGRQSQPRTSRNDHTCL
jgi:GNAT superfamily N-acetyltransferase